MQRFTVVVEVDASGDAVAYSPPGLNGPVHMIKYVKDDYADGVDFTIVLEATGESLWTDTNINASEIVYPVQKANLGGTGAASTILEQPIIAVNDRIKFTIAAGGVSKGGSFIVVMA
jgi:hypothetical protein